MKNSLDMRLILIIKCKNIISLKYNITVLVCHNKETERNAVKSEKEREYCNIIDRFVITEKYIARIYYNIVRLLKS